MNIVLVNDNAQINGGIARVAISEAVAFAREGHDVTYFAAIGPVEEELREAGVKVIVLNQQDILEDPQRIRAAGRGLYNRAAAEALRQCLRDLPTEETVVHFHSWLKALSPFILTIPHEMGVKTVVTLHDFFAACPNGGFYNHQKHEICHLKPFSAKCLASGCDSRSHLHKAWRLVRTAMQNRLFGALEKVDAFVPVSHFCYRILEPYLPSETPVRVIENPIEVAPTTAASPEDHETAVFVGRLSPEKGAGDLAEAARQLRIPATFVGDGSLAGELRTRYPEADWRGWMAHEDVLSVVRSARCLVFPSTWYETQGLTVLEAMANGIPVIISDCTAATEYVRHGLNGLHYKSANQEDLCDKLRQLQDPRLAARLGQQAHDWFWNERQRRTPHHLQLTRLYRDLWSGNASSSSVNRESTASFATSSNSAATF
jgi:glycosyltransferase involved in cell wall biosynthesis